MAGGLFLHRALFVRYGVAGFYKYWGGGAGGWQRSRESIYHPTDVFPCHIRFTNLVYERKRRFIQDEMKESLVEISQYDSLFFCALLFWNQKFSYLA